MKRASSSLLCLLLLLLGMLVPAALAEVTKVACVGDSITYGAQIPQREVNSYPAQLQQMLNKEAPDKWEVKNFGVRAMTLMQKTDKPYVKRQEYRDSLAYGADVVIIMLGTNDSKNQYRDILADNYKADYHKLIASYREGREGNEPRIILMLPPKCYVEGPSINEKTLRGTVVPLIRDVAKEEGLELIDLYGVHGTTWDAKLLPDKVHPSAEGAALMAKEIAPVVAKEGGK